MYKKNVIIILVVLFSIDLSAQYKIYFKGPAANNLACDSSPDGSTVRNGTVDATLSCATAPSYDTHNNVYVASPGSISDLNYQARASFEVSCPMVSGNEYILEFFSETLFTSGHSTANDWQFYGSFGCSRDQLLGSSLSLAGAAGCGMRSITFTANDAYTHVFAVPYTTTTPGFNGSNATLYMNNIGDTCEDPCGAGGNETFSYTGSNQTFTVPAGVTSINVKAWGAGGGGQGSSYIGGAGGYASGDLNVTPGDQLIVMVGEGGKRNSSSTANPPATYGGGGAGGRALGPSTNNGLYHNGCSGGGLSGIFINSVSQGNAIIIAGGGGGAVGQGVAGNGGSVTANSAQGLAGAIGLGGSGSAGGSGGSRSLSGGNGSALAGGDGGGGGPCVFGMGGGGGGGYYGGGGGSGQANCGNAAENQEMPGGGGSGFIHSSVASGINSKGTTQGTPPNSDPDYPSGIGEGGGMTDDNGGNGFVIISWSLDPCDCGGGSSPSQDVTEVFNYTGTTGTYTIPAGVTEIEVKAWGAGGGGSYNATSNSQGGCGGYAEGTLAVVPGQQLTIITGEAGKAHSEAATFGGGGGAGSVSLAANTQGGSGGGRSAIRLGSVELLTAGGGGGAAGANGLGCAPSSTGFSGLGGGASGSSCTNCGGGGTQSSGGAGGGSGSVQGEMGSQYMGGTGGDGSHNGSGGGGGGGYYGGGGGKGDTGITNCTDAAQDFPGGGGSGYIGGVTGGSMQVGSGITPPNILDSNYPSGSGVGFGGGPGQDGGPGLIVINYSIPGVVCCNDGSIILRNSEAKGCPDNITVDFKIYNGDAADMPAGTPITFYDGDPTMSGANVLYTYELPFFLQSGATENFNDIELVNVCSLNNGDLIYAVLADDGSNYSTGNPLDLSTLESDGYDDCTMEDNMTIIKLKDICARYESMIKKE